MILFRKKRCTLSLFLLVFQILASSSLLAQTISGKVINETDKSPMPFANVFLNTTQLGTTTDGEGNFILNNIPLGTYELVVSYVGYQVTTQTIEVGKINQPFQIELAPKDTQLQEIVVQEDKNYQLHYDYFVENFIGKTPLSKFCKIINPDIVYLKYDYDSLLLKVRTDEFLVIENKALGYRIKYLLSSFRDDGRTGYQSVLGYTLFEELKGSKRQKQKWKQEREKAYKGSFNHFCKALLNNTCVEEGFLVRKLVRSPNPDRLTDEVIKAAFQRVRNQSTINSDSLIYWSDESKKPKLIETLYPDIIATDTLLKKQQDYTLLSFEDYLYIVYTNEKEDDLYLQGRRKFGEAIEKKSFQSSLISLTEKTVFFDSKGYIINPLAILTEEYWAWQEKIAEMLPINYSIDEK